MRPALLSALTRVDRTATSRRRRFRRSARSPRRGARAAAGRARSERRRRRGAPPRPALARTAARRRSRAEWTASADPTRRSRARPSRACGAGRRERRAERAAVSTRWSRSPAMPARRDGACGARPLPPATIAAVGGGLSRTRPAVRLATCRGARPGAPSRGDAAHRSGARRQDAEVREAAVLGARRGSARADVARPLRPGRRAIRPRRSGAPRARRWPRLVRPAAATARLTRRVASAAWVSMPRPRPSRQRAAAAARSRARAHRAVLRRRPPRLLADRLAGLVTEGGFQSFLDYYYFLKYDPAAADGVGPRHGRAGGAGNLLLAGGGSAAGRRRRDRARVVARRVARADPDLVRAVRERRRTADAGDAARRAGWFDRAEIELYASDASPAAIEKARRGRYRERSFRALPPHVRERYFTPAGDEWEVDPGAARAGASWSVVNLGNRSEVEPLRRAPTSSSAATCSSTFRRRPFATRVTLVRRPHAHAGLPLRRRLGVAAARDARFELEEIAGAFVYVEASRGSAEASGHEHRPCAGGRRLGLRPQGRQADAAAQPVHRGGRHRAGRRRSARTGRRAEPGRGHLRPEHAADGRHRLRARADGAAPGADHHHQRREPRGRAGARRPRRRRHRLRAEADGARDRQAARHRRRAGGKGQGGGRRRRFVTGCPVAVALPPIRGRRGARRRSTSC